MKYYNSFKGQQIMIKVTLYKALICYSWIQPWLSKSSSNIWLTRELLDSYDRPGHLKFLSKTYPSIV